MNSTTGATPQRVRMGPLMVACLVLVLVTVNAVVIWGLFQVAGADIGSSVGRPALDAVMWSLWGGTIGAVVLLVAAWWTSRAHWRRWLMAGATLAAALPWVIWLIPTLLSVWDLLRAASDTAGAG
jgi:hypothetical protein